MSYLKIWVFLTYHHYWYHHIILFFFFCYTGTIEELVRIAKIAEFNENKLWYREKGLEVMLEDIENKKDIKEKEEEVRGLKEIYQHMQRKIHGELDSTKPISNDDIRENDNKDNDSPNKKSSQEKIKHLEKIKALAQNQGEDLETQFENYLKYTFMNEPYKFRRPSGAPLNSYFDYLKEFYKDRDLFKMEKIPVQEIKGIGMNEPRKVDWNKDTGKSEK